MGAGSIRVSAMVMLRDETRARQLVTRFPPGHEVVFVYSAAVPSGFVPDEGAWSVEADGSAMYLEWRSTDALLDAPLYPAPGYQETGSAFPSS